MPEYFDPQTLAAIQTLRMRANHIVEGFVAGLHRSPFHGFSIEFAEHREYVPGDDLRHLDWKVWGRTDRLYLKQYEDETNLICYLVLDVSESMDYRGPDAPLSKLEYGQCLAAALAWLTLRQQDAVGLATFDEEVRRVVRPSSMATQLPQLVSVLEEPAGRRRTNAGRIFHELAERFTKRGVVVVLSDLLDEPESLLAGLKHFRHRRHDVILLHLLDAAEVEFPFDRLTMFEGLEELPEALVDGRSVREAYLDEMERFQAWIRGSARSQNMDYQLVRTDRSVAAALSDFLAARSARIR